MDIKEKVYLAIEYIISKKIDIDDNLLLKEDLNIDSIKGFRLLMYLEDNNIVLKNNVFNKIETIKDLINSLEIKS